MIAGNEERKELQSRPIPCFKPQAQLSLAILISDSVTFDSGLQNTKALYLLIFICEHCIPDPFVALQALHRDVDPRH